MNTLACVAQYMPHANDTAIDFDCGPCVVVVVAFSRLRRLSLGKRIVNVAVVVAAIVVTETSTVWNGNNVQNDVDLIEL